MIVTNYTPYLVKLEIPNSWFCISLKSNESVEGDFKNMWLGHMQTFLLGFETQKLQNTGVVVVFVNNNCNIYPRLRTLALATSGISNISFPLPEYIRVHNNTNEIIRVFGHATHLICPGESVMAYTCNLFMSTLDPNRTYTTFLNTLTRLWQQGKIYQDGNNLFIVN